MPIREQICASAGAKLAKANAAAVKALIGFDGFVDSIIDVVDKRHSATSYDRMKTLADLGAKISAAAGQSANMELFVKMQKLGGNGPIMANAMASIGFGVTYVGNLGFPEAHVVFKDMCERAKVYSIAEPGYTDALEFTDGKLMLGKHQSLRDVTWENILAVVGKDNFLKAADASSLIGMVNWTMLPFMTDIWQKLSTEVLPVLSKKERRIFIDLADPEKRLIEDIRNALAMLQKINEQVHVILGLNLSEAIQVNRALGLPDMANAENEIEKLAVQIRTKLAIGTVVVHPRKGAAAANAAGSAAFAGPFVQNPKISTGAGDHFNAGFVTGQLLGLDLAESLCSGTATSGYYVRNAQSPSLANLADFIKNLPAPQA